MHIVLIEFEIQYRDILCNPLISSKFKARLKIELGKTQDKHSEPNAANKQRARKSLAPIPWALGLLGQPHSWIKDNFANKVKTGKLSKPRM